MTCENLLPFAIQIRVNWKNSQDYEAEYAKVNKLNKAQSIAEIENLQLREQGMPSMGIKAPKSGVEEVKARS